MALAVGTVVAGYRIEGVLGAGGMGTVYLARHPTLPRNDALKILSAELSLDEEFRARFIREADLAATLNHPNIVTVSNRGETEDGQLWIAMEYVDGTAANDLASANLTPARIVRIITDVAVALDFAHSRRILHRDVKPGNFLISAPGTPDERVLLADFGIARALDDATSLTATGSMVFTAAYAAPEAIEGQHVDHRADIYSLGCSLFRLLTGRTPYGDTGSLAAILMAHMMRPVPRPSEAAPGLPPAIDEVIARAMAKDPADRFATAGDLASATAAALAGHTAAPAPAAADTRSWTTTPVSYPTAPPTAPPMSPARPDPARPTVPPGQQFPVAPYPAPRRRKRALVLGAVVLAVAAVIAAVTVFLVGSRGGGGSAPYQSQTLNGMFGTVQLSHRPLSIAALGPGDPDAVLSLGVQPVLIGGMPGKLPSWLQSLAHSSPPVIGVPDPGALSASKPDLIIDTGAVDKATYDKLSAIAPTLTRPPDSAQDWTWQAQLTWIARALGRTETAKTLISDAASQQADIKSQHTGFGGKSVTVVTYSGAATTVAARVSPPTSYLEGLGFTYNADYRRGPTDPPEAGLANPGALARALSTAVVVLCRTDPAAGGGGYNGLPAGFNAYSGILVIVDDPATIAALNVGGPAATAYLNDALVKKLSNQVR